MVITIYFRDGHMCLIFDLTCTTHNPRVIHGIMDLYNTMMGSMVGPKENVVFLPLAAQSLPVKFCP